MAGSRRAVFVCCDGLGRDWVRPETTPVLARFARQEPVVRRAQRGVPLGDARLGRLDRHRLPSGAAWPAWQPHGPVARTAGSSCATSARRISATTCAAPPAARCWCRLDRRARRQGGRLHRLLERLAGRRLLPRSRAFRPRLSPQRHARARRQELAPWTSRHDSAGDWAMTQRFCTEVLSERKPAVALHVDLRSRPHAAWRAARLAGACRGAGRADRCVAEVIARSSGCAARARRSCCWSAPTMAMRRSATASSIEDWLAAHGLWKLLEAGDVAVAGQGTSALLYATDRGRAGLLGVARRDAPRAVGRRRPGRRRLAAQGFAAEGGVSPPSTWRAGRGQSLRRARPALGGDGRQARAGRLRPARRPGDRTRRGRS